jgi:hypothetical protein
MAMKVIEPMGRARKASANSVKAYSVPSNRSANGKNTRGKTNTDAIPYTKKSKCSDARPMMTPIAISPGAISDGCELTRRISRANVSAGVSVAMAA